VLTFDRQVRTRVTFEAWRAMVPAERAQQVQRRLEVIQPGWAATQLDVALIAAAEALEEAETSARRAARRRVVVVSDLQEGSRLERLQGYDWPAGVELTLETVAPRQLPNAGLHVVLTDDRTTTNRVAEGVRARVTNSEDARQEQFQLRWDGTPLQAALAIHVPAGQSRVVLSSARPEGSAGERLVLSGDEHPFDNAAYVVPPLPEEVQVWYLGPPTEGDPTQSLYYLRRALANTRGRSIRLAPLADAAALTTSALPQVPVAIVDGALPTTAFDPVRRFLESGGTVLWVLAEGTPPEPLRNLTGAGEVRIEPAAVNQYAMWGQIDFRHPLFAAFSDARYSDFTKIHFWRYRRLAWEGLPEARVLARFDSGDPALVEVPRGQGRLMFLTSGWRPADGQLALSSKFVPLMHALLDYARGPRPPVVHCRVGDEVTLPATAGGLGGRVRPPDGGEVTLAAGQTRFAGTDTPGIYRVTQGDRSWRFAVNLDPAESRTVPLAGDDLERLGIALHAPAADTGRRAIREQHLRDTELEERQKFWRWLLLAALGILVVESWLAGRLTRVPTGVS
jgi:hypothetical protein